MSWPIGFVPVALIMFGATGAFAVPVTITYSLNPGGFSQNVTVAGGPITSGTLTMTFFGSSATACLAGSPLVSGSGACMRALSFATTAGSTAHLDVPLFWTSPTQSVAGAAPFHDVSFYTYKNLSTLRLEAAAGVITSLYISGMSFALNSTCCVFVNQIALIATENGGQEVPEPRPVPLVGVGILLLLTPYVLRRRRRSRASIFAPRDLF